MSYVRQLRNPIQPGDGDPRHGTVGAYVNHNCRCEQCRDANRTYNARRRKERRAGKRPTSWAMARGATGQPKKHNRYTYFNWGCRCDVCKSDYALYQVESVARRKNRKIPGPRSSHVCDAPFPVTVGGRWKCPVCLTSYMGGVVNHPNGKVMGWSSV